MDSKIIEYLSKEKICSLTTTLSDNTLHAAALHFSYKDEPFEMYFSTENTSRKCSGMLNGEIVNAAVVVGFSEEEFKTLQLDGDVQIVSDADELLKVHEVHYFKHPSSE